MRPLILSCLAAVSLTFAACSDDAPSAQSTAAPAPAATEEEGEPEPDIVHARRALMDEMHAQMGPIDRAAAGDPFDLASARVRAGAVSVMLLAFPHLFPEGTDANATAGNYYKSNATDAVWEHSEAFFEMSEHASEIAFDLIAITDEAAFRAKAAELRAACNACHAVYLSVSPE